MIEPITFTVLGKPQPAGSKRAFVIKKGGHYTGRAIVIDANKGAKDWKIDVQHAARAVYSGEPLTCPISLALQFTVERPNGHYRTGKNAGCLRDSAPEYPIGRPDATKLCRGVEDALTGLLWKDDAQVVTQKITKRYGLRPGVVVCVSEAVL